MVSNYYTQQYIQLLISAFVKVFFTFFHIIISIWISHKLKQV